MIKKITQVKDNQNTTRNRLTQSVNTTSRLSTEHCLFTSEGVFMPIGTHLKTPRTLLGYTQEDVSKLLRISPETLFQWEENKQLPNDTSLLNLRSLYHMETTDLLDSKSAASQEKLIHKILRAFNRPHSKEQSPPLSEADLSNTLQKKGLIITPIVKETTLANEATLLEAKLTTRYYGNVEWLTVDALDARKIVAIEAIDLIIFTPITAIFTQQIEHVAITSPTLIILSRDLYDQLTALTND
ncbi:helix-turn-helix transcriptional regulator [Vagococcus sp. BWB3-3]|uniref:Helix-turn-helix transcriptional regulator n=1 Tax=Vagococcus allomyrinae TaxID=2794353 RepID=A0A940SUY1_9ENTE|nr:helix-turn-helix transcriptional regulator [Vagococcus allomyrinae]MBP1039793.1 helix-turn-helix transcriptional regulator [Vagococcus allomyrinae]